MDMKSRGLSCDTQQRIQKISWLINTWSTSLILAFPEFGKVFKQVDFLNYYVSLELLLN